MVLFALLACLLPLEAVLYRKCFPGMPGRQLLLLAGAASLGGSAAGLLVAGGLVFDAGTYDISLTPFLFINLWWLFLVRVAAGLIVFSASHPQGAWEGFEAVVPPVFRVNLLSLGVLCAGVLVPASLRAFSLEPWVELAFYLGLSAAFFTLGLLHGRPNRTVEWWVPALLALPMLYVVSLFVPLERVLPPPPGVLFQAMLAPLFLVPGFAMARLGRSPLFQHLYLALLPLVFVFVTHETVFLFSTHSRQDMTTLDPRYGMAMQSRGNTCFVACVRNLCRHRGADFRRGDVVRAARLGVYGVHPARMASVIERECGRNCHGVRRRWMSARALRDRGGPAMLLTLHMGCIPHVVLLKKVERGMLVILDPAQGVLYVAPHQLWKKLHYTGMALTIPDTREWKG